MTDDIVNDSSDVNVLKEHAAAIRRACRAFEADGKSQLEHAFAGGKHVIAAQDRIGRGLRAWLKDHQLSKTLAYDFMLLARNEESVRSSGHSSVAAALRMLRKANGRSKKTKNRSAPDQISLWKRANDEERRAFLDAIGVDDFRQAMSLNFYRRLRDLVRVEKVESTTSGKGSMLLKKGLSHIKSADKDDTSEAERASNAHEAFNCLRALLKLAEGDPHRVSIGFDSAKKKAAA
jgi:hypothetical protein